MRWRLFIFTLREFNLAAKFPSSVGGVAVKWFAVITVLLSRPKLGHEAFDGGANINILYTVEPEKAFDPLVSAMPKQTLVQVRKAET